MTTRRPSSVGELPAPELHGHHRERDEAEDDADHGHRRAQVLAQVDGLERERERRRPHVDEDAGGEHPELAREGEQVAQVRFEAGEHASHAIRAHTPVALGVEKRSRTRLPKPTRQALSTLANLQGRSPRTARALTSPGGAARFRPMYLSVQQAALRLGVSPVTIRRWTATGFLPCTRTAGGHRRIDEHDIDDLAKAIGGSNHLAAQLAREREVDVLINTATALAVKLDLTELLLEIAMRMTSLLDCHFCAVSEYDVGERRGAARWPSTTTPASASPTRAPTACATSRSRGACSSEQTTAVVNVDDPHADPAEVAELRREGDRSLLMVPLVVQGRSLGLLEVVDQKRSRDYSRQELRLAEAIAGQAAVAIQNAKLFAERPTQRRGHRPPARGAREPHRPRAAAGRGRAPRRRPLHRRPGRVRGARRHLLRGEPGRRERRRVRRRPGRRRRRTATSAARAANLVVARDPSGRTDLTLAVTLPHAPGRGPGRAARLRRRRHGRRRRAAEPRVPPPRSSAGS